MSQFAKRLIISISFLVLLYFMGSVGYMMIEDLSFLDAVRRGVFTVPGDGFIDFLSIFSVLEDTGYEGWVVVEAEQDPAKANPLEYALMARKYIKKTAGL